MLLRLWVCGALVLAACGRTALQPTTQSTDQDASLPPGETTPDDEPIGDIDTPPEPFCTGKADGTACDDNDVCTPVASCMSGACVGSGGQSPCLLINSDQSFAGAQGANNLFYGFWDEEADADGIYDPGTDFTQMDFRDTGSTTYQINDLWKPVGTPTDCCAAGFVWTMLSKSGGHPSASPHQLPTRRWVSATSGPATVSVHFVKSDFGGDGTAAVLFVDGQEMLRRMVEGTDSVGFDQDVRVTLKAGSVVDLMIDALATEAQDTTSTTFSVAN